MLLSFESLGKQMPMQVINHGSSGQGQAPDIDNRGSVKSTEGVRSEREEAEVFCGFAYNEHDDCCCEGEASRGKSHNSKRPLGDTPLHPLGFAKERFADWYIQACKQCGLLGEDLAVVQVGNLIVKEEFGDHVEDRDGVTCNGLSFGSRAYHGIGLPLEFGLCRTTTFDCTTSSVCVGDGRPSFGSPAVSRLKLAAHELHRLSAFRALPWATLPHREFIFLSAPTLRPQRQSGHNPRNAERSLLQFHVTLFGRNIIHSSHFASPEVLICSSLTKPFLIVEYRVEERRRPLEIIIDIVLAATFRESSGLESLSRMRLNSPPLPIDCLACSCARAGGYQAERVPNDKAKGMGKVVQGEKRVGTNKGTEYLSAIRCHLYPQSTRQRSIIPAKPEISSERYVYWDIPYIMDCKASNWELEVQCRKKPSIVRIVRTGDPPSYTFSRHGKEGQDTDNDITSTLVVRRMPDMGDRKMHRPQYEGEYNEKSLEKTQDRSEIFTVREHQLNGGGSSPPFLYEEGSAATCRDFLSLTGGQSRYPSRRLPTHAGNNLTMIRLTVGWSHVNLLAGEKSPTLPRIMSLRAAPTRVTRVKDIDGGNAPRRIDGRRMRSRRRRRRRRRRDGDRLRRFRTEGQTKRPDGEDGSGGVGCGKSGQQGDERRREREREREARPEREGGREGEGRSYWERRGARHSLTRAEHLFAISFAFASIFLPVLSAAAAAAAGAPFRLTCRRCRWSFSAGAAPSRREEGSSFVQQRRVDFICPSAGAELEASEKCVFVRAVTFLGRRRCGRNSKTGREGGTQEEKEKRWRTYCAHESRAGRRLAGRRSGRYSLRRLCFGLMKLAVRKNSFLVVDFMNFDNFLSNGRVRRWLGLARETIWLEPFNCIGPFLRSVCRSSVKSKLYVSVFPASLCDGNFWE
ncbi:hypothetical protein MARPO_0027s0116 [Marchantia polymorpha]|uniref:Uncharacterized protein n=1 Tax=Marchantia polymorpha TaxID=3197 RepID=A0A2R6XA85_MARPO|nr:hypothetical protein MARPO_0027s0116 [Marchantia polymorpha]|eukprot:PTQ43014.1 hypothetical protein MARPO_0027s0116 [Marchantia polymorpha]